MFFNTTMLYKKTYILMRLLKPLLVLVIGLSFFLGGVLSIAGSVDAEAVSPSDSYVSVVGGKDSNQPFSLLEGPEGSESAKGIAVGACAGSCACGEPVCTASEKTICTQWSCPVCDAVVSASHDEPYCSPASPGGSSNVTIRWSMANAATQGCASAGVLIQQYAGGEWQGILGIDDFVDGKACTDSHTFQGLSYHNNPHRYYVYWYNSSGLQITQTGEQHFTSMDCDSLASPVPGSCGPAEKIYAYNESFPAGTFCNSGSANPSNPTSPAPGGSSSWVCLGSSGGGSDSCTATRESTPTPSVELVISDTDIDEDDPQPTMRLHTQNVQLDPATCTTSNPCKCTVSYTNNAGYSGTITTLKHRPYNSATGNYEVQGSDPGYMYITPEPAATTYTAQCLGVDGNTAEDVVTVTVSPAETAVSGASCSASPNPANVNDAVQWTATASGGTQPYTCTWSGAVSGNGCTKSIPGGYSSDGVKNASVIVTSSSGLSSDTASCSVDVEAPPPPQCSDGGDNGDADSVADAADPGCHSDGDAGNSGSYTPNDNDEGAPPAAVQIDATPRIVNPGTPTELEWTATNVASCVITGPGGPWTGANSPAGGQQTGNVTQTTTFTITCNDLDGGQESDSVIVRLNPNFQEE